MTNDAAGNAMDESSIVDTGQRPLPGTDLTVGPLAYGCWRFAGTSVADAQAKVEAALDAGMNLIDTADIYGASGPGFGTAEELLGQVLAAAPSLRDRMVLATKGGIRPPVPYDSSPAYLRRAAEDSLRRLGVDHVDLWQLHRPDLVAHPEAVAGALAGIVNDGLARTVGVSNYSPARLSALHRHCQEAGVELATTQPELSLLFLEPIDNGLLDQAMELGLLPLAWSPLAGGRLVDQRSADDPAVGPVTVELDRIAHREGVPRSAVALAWVLAHPSRPIAIVGTQQVERILGSTASLQVHLTRFDWYELIKATGRSLP